MDIDITRLTPAYPDSVHIQWEIFPDEGVTGSYRFDVFKSGSPLGPWTNISGVLTDEFFFVDDFTVKLDTDLTSDESNLQSFNRDVYYQVSVIDPANSVATSSPVDLDGVAVPKITENVIGMGSLVDDSSQYEPPPSSGIAIRPNQRIRNRLLRRKILREEYIGFRRLNGVAAKILKRKHFGEFCTNCRDRLTEALTVYKCPVCFGTGWSGGFFAPVPTYIRVAPTANQTTLTEGGDSVSNTTTITMLNYPEVKRDDIIVIPSNGDRYIVKAVQPTQLKLIVVHQEVQVALLSRSSVEYGIPV